MNHCASSMHYKPVSRSQHSEHQQKHFRQHRSSCLPPDDNRLVCHSVSLETQQVHYTQDPYTKRKTIKLDYIKEILHMSTDN